MRVSGRVTVMLWLWLGTISSQAGVAQLGSPADFSLGATQINFEGYADLTIADQLFGSQGVSFGRDDGKPVHITDWSALGRTTVSAANVLETRADADYLFATHLNVFCSRPMTAFGAYFGNDQAYPFLPLDDFVSIRLSAYDPSDEFLGSVSVNANENTSVDQFIGISSDTPFARLRFENLMLSGNPSQYYAVVLDQMTFTVVPEPSTVCLLGLGLLCSAKLCARRLRG